MAGGYIAESKYGEKKVESVRTVDCLRGRLLAERQASRNAKEEADKLGIKLMELESELRQEARAMKRAEKKLKLVLKKLESLNIVEQQSCRSEVSSVSSSKTHGKECPQMMELGGDGPAEMWARGNDNGTEPTSDLEEYGDSERSGQDSKMDEQSGGCEEIDNSMALVAVDVKMKERRVVYPQVLDDTVTELLDVLRHAREQIQTSLEKRGRGRRIRHNMSIRAS